MIPHDALVVLDTNVLVHLLRNDRVGQRVERDHRLTERPERPLISYVTLAELRALTLKLNWGKRRIRELDALLDQVIVVHVHQGNILEKYAELDHFSEKVAKPARRMEKNDLWIASTVADVEAVLVTTDSDFDHLVANFFERLKVDPATGATSWN